ncbi:MAG: AAA family ATPase [Hamadaea sp.]|uniref:chloramphenicol phosphotransferase CPT family protein n=1 Tax=Hamadaea sp. TaxID=2024425 RepID=UPI0017DC5E97|nr:AAA family ATPase [Hamadaea sp.]NUR71450.1 AAA family ATPase [Hamadaea sp.]NUT23760.1 AAA family ATPase [Hamadaea sp.]
MSQVVFLNGASSAGKTSIGTALQEVTADPFMLLGIDTCFAMVPSRWAGGPAGPFRHLGFAYQQLPADDGHPMLAITYGEVGRRMMAGFHRGVVEIVRAGNSVIIDEMLLDERVRDDWLEVLARLRPLVVGVFCDDEELERREKARGNRPGLARWSARQAHRGVTYHLEVDTTTTESAVCAAAIARHLSPGLGV